MGINYYVSKKMSYDKKRQAIRYIKNDEIGGLIDMINSIDRIHIGKYSHGWQFLFNANERRYYDLTRESIDNFIRDENYRFENEYGEIVDPDKFWEMVDETADGLNGIRYDAEREPEARERNLHFFRTAPYEFYENNLRFSTTTEFG